MIRNAIETDVFHAVRGPFDEVFSACAQSRETGSSRDDQLNSVVEYPMLSNLSNAWEKHPQLRAFVFGKRLARMAAELLDVPRVRLWHDNLLMKRPHRDGTQCHCDGYRNAMATARACVAWVPLQPTPTPMGAMGFYSGSHRAIGLRSKLYPVEDGPAAWAAHDEKLRRELAEAGCDYQVTDYALGDVSFHGIWTFHSAEANRTDELRRVIRIVFVDADMILTEPITLEAAKYHELYAPDVEPGEMLNSPYTPIVYDEERDAPSVGTALECSPAIVDSST